MDTPFSNQLEKYAANYVGTLPDEALRALIKTDDQLSYFYSLKTFYRVVSICWQARLEGLDDPLAEALEQGILPQWHYDDAWEKVEYLQSLWSLVQLAGRFVKAEARAHNIDYPFNSAKDLFIEIVQVTADGAFKISTSPYFEVSTGKISKLAKLTCDMLALEEEEKANPAEEKKLSNRFKPLKTSGPKNPWLRLLIESVLKHQHRSKPLKTAYSNYRQSLSRQAIITGKLATQKRDTRDVKKIHSHVWKSGEVVPVEKHGGHYKT